MEAFEYLMPIFTEYGYVAVFMMLLVCGFGVPIPEDVTLLTGGVIAGLGYANVHYMFIVGMIGVLVGDGLIFFLGRQYGAKVFGWPVFRLILTPSRFEKSQGVFQKYGRRVMFVARFLPGLRTPVFFTAGMSHRVSYGNWLLMDGLAALVSVPIWVYLGYFGALNWEWMFNVLRKFQITIIIVLVLLAMIVAVRMWQNHRQAQRSLKQSHP